MQAQQPTNVEARKTLCIVFAIVRLVIRALTVILLARVNVGLNNKPLNLRTEGVVLLKEPPRPRPIKLTLLKSSSTKDLSRLYELDNTPQTPVTLLSFTSSSNLNKMSSFTRLESLERKVYDLEKELEELRKKFKQFAKDHQDGQGKHKKHSATTPTSPTVKPSKLVTWMKLSSFWSQRPSIQTLKDQNIYNDEPCFDTKLELVLKDETHSTVPKIVVDCCQIIEEKCRMSTERVEGIYRERGDYNTVQAIRFSIDANDYSVLKQPYVDIHTLAGVLKLFLREIKRPLVSAFQVKAFVGHPNQWFLTELNNKLKMLKSLMRTLPEINRDTMKYLFKHFHKLTKIPLQQISAETLSMYITPSIFQTLQLGSRFQNVHMSLEEIALLTDCVKIMIEYHKKIFE